MAKIKDLQYQASDFGKAEVALQNKFQLQRDDARNYFIQYQKPRLDLSHKLNVAYNGDRARDIQPWQANVFIPYVMSTVETLMPRILDARPEYSVAGRGPEDQDRALKIQMLNDYTWEVSGMDDVSELLVRSALVNGTSWLKSYWKRDRRTQKFLKKGTDPSSKKQKYIEKTVTFYDGPFAEAIDPYSFFYDWRNIPHASKQFFFQRSVLNGSEIKRRYPQADPRRLAMALNSSASNLTEYAHVRYDVKSTHSRAVKGDDSRYRNAGYDIVDGYPNSWTIRGGSMDRYQGQLDQDLRFYEVFEWYRPFDDAFSVMVGDVPILTDAETPIPFDHKEAPYIDLPFLRLPFEYEGLGIPLLLEQPQLMLNLVKNQRLDNSTLAVHKMWIVNPLAGVKQEQLVPRPFGIIYSPDPNGVKPVEFSDIKSSAFQEEELLKGDMRYASGVDDFSMGTGSNAGSATEIRHLRESTLERVRLFINHLGSCYSKKMRFDFSMYAQFMSKEMQIRITGEDGQVQYPLIEKDDLYGNFDFKATVLPSIAGKQEVEKKMAMDLFQLLVQMPFIDPKKLTSKTLFPWGWTVGSIAKDEEAQAPQDPNAQMAQDPNAPQDPNAQMQPQDPNAQPSDMSGLNTFMGATPNGSGLDPNAVAGAMRILTGGPQPLPPGAAGQSPFAEASKPIKMDSKSTPPTVKGIGKGGENTRGLNRSGSKVNTALPGSRGGTDTASHASSQANNTSVGR